ncbi:hypothetical protein E4U55_002605 [Claviceps digitariae]|nr:hypothetical protein E4U55_002605 [Claviceps digitariae]
MNGDQSAEPEKPPPSDATDGGSSNGADGLGKKRKKDSLKPIITTEDIEGDAQSAKQDSKIGCAKPLSRFNSVMHYQGFSIYMDELIMGSTSVQLDWSSSGSPRKVDTTVAARRGSRRRTVAQLHNNCYKLSKVWSMHVPGDLWSLWSLVCPGLRHFELVRSGSFTAPAPGMRSN